jgi:hypothetical protein
VPIVGLASVKSLTLIDGLPPLPLRQDRYFTEKNREALAGAARVVLKSKGGQLAIPMNQGTVVRPKGPKGPQSIPNAFRVSGPAPASASES